MLSPRFVALLFPKPQEQLKEYLLDASCSELLKKMPQGLQPYVVARLGVVQLEKSSKLLAQQKVFQEFKARKEVFPTKTRLHSWIRSEPRPLKLQFFIQYKGVKQTKDQRPHLLLNYIAREGEIAEGFEASENLKTSFQINKRFKIVSYLGVFEKWVNHRKDYDKTYFLTMDHPDVLKDVKVSASVKYAMGCSYERPLAKEKKLFVDLMLQHKANHHWKYIDKTFSNGVFSGSGLDHWILTTGLTF